MQAYGPKKPSSLHRDKCALTKDEQGAEGGAQRREPARTLSVLGYAADGFFNAPL